ncbi:MAG: YggT family protein [Rhodospirillales bacterium]|nr:YggT family protein [Rhodospirillales bacterium]
MDVILVPLLHLIIKAIDLYMIVVIAAVIMSWLVSFGMVNTSNRIVYAIGDFIYRITEPAFRQLRNILPNLGGIDIAPIALMLILWAIQEVLARLILRIV